MPQENLEIHPGLSGKDNRRLNSVDFADLPSEERNRELAAFREKYSIEGL